jgi:uncharacterized membrane protein YkvA (DUF1232 family)
MPKPASVSRALPQLDWRLIRQLPNFVRLYWRLWRDRRVSVVAKGIMVLAVAYILLPFDLLPDVLPIVGRVDDLVLFLAACKAFLFLCPRPVVHEHVQRIDREARA